eukprot:scaffold5386_cov98-Isochrysis_galbana.AAC.9
MQFATVPEPEREPCSAKNASEGRHPSAPGSHGPHPSLSLPLSLCLLHSATDSTALIQPTTP